jgi:hypothetical protein
MAHTPGPFSIEQPSKGFAGYIIHGAQTWDELATVLASATDAEDNARLFTAAPDLLAALHAITANTRAENPEAIAAFDLAERAIAKATGTPAGWTHAETSAPDDPTQCQHTRQLCDLEAGTTTCDDCGALMPPKAYESERDSMGAKQQDLRPAIEAVRQGLGKICNVLGNASAPKTPEQLKLIGAAIMAAWEPLQEPLMMAAAADHQPTAAAQAVESFIATEQQDLPLPDLLAAILRRAERAKSYGRIMMTSKDSCIDDVVRLATRALLLANDQAEQERASLVPFKEAMEQRK